MQDTNEAGAATLVTRNYDVDNITKMKVELRFSSDLLRVYIILLGQQHNNFYYKKIKLFTYVQTLNSMVANADSFQDVAKY